ncbi:MAG: substrate-binding domain-containing protein [Spirochaetales bacterium]|nr:substrate-binding domain-containing protein [Spirochaetales bacterium]
MVFKVTIKGYNSTIQEMKEKRLQKSCQRVGVFTAWFYGHYQMELFSGIEEMARHHKVQALYFSGRALHSPLPYENDHNIIYDTALHASLDGLIISLLAIYCNDNILTEFISRYKNIPVITINFRSAIGNAIFADNKPGFNALMKHLIEKHGFRKLAFVKGPEHNRDAMERYTLYKSALAEHGIDFNPALVTAGHFMFRAGQDAVRVYLDERGLKPGRDIEVIVCANDIIALGVIDELYNHGLHVPRDIAVTGFDNTNESIFPKFPLTSVKQNLREIGKKAICNLLDYKPDQEPLFFDTELVIRDSCGCSKSEEQTGLPETGRERKSVFDYGYSHRSGHKKDLEFIYYEITRIIENLKDLQTMTEFSAWMQDNFPILGIESAWLFLYTRVPSNVSTYTLLAGYDIREPGGIHQKDNIPEKMIFDDILCRRPDRSFCILPLLFKETRYGLVVMEVNISTSLVYDTLSSHIGSSIKNILLGEEVARINLQLLQSSKQKTQFFINMAHETKTPLTLIQNYLALCLEQNKADEKLLIIKQNIDLLLGNMLNFLDEERLKKGDIIYQHNVFVDLTESVYRKCEMFRAMSAKKNIRMTVDAENHFIIRIDPLALDRILNNLLDNAVKYTQGGGRIKVDVFCRKGKAILRISDNGPGLPADTYEHIFEPYYLLSRKRNRQQGTGVGLSIVKEIIDGLGAEITAEKNEGGGTCFTIAFTDESSTAEQKKIIKFKATPPPSYLVEEDIKEKNITADKHSLFIVDDNIQLLKFIQTTLSESYNIYFARNTAEALIKLKIIPSPDLIISDIMMDGEDGFGFLSALSAKEGFNDIPFIFITALGGEKAVVKGLDLGAVDYIEKPFSIAALRAKIESIIALRGRQEKHDRECIRNRIDGLLYGLNKDTGDAESSRLERLCKKYVILGREREIIRMLVSGLLNKEIAGCMNITQRTVEYHITKIYKKCGVNNRYDLLNIFRNQQ